MIIVNRQIPPKTRQYLEKLGAVLLFETNNITYPQISGHPDVFFCTGNNKLIAAPNTPEKYLSGLQNKGIEFVTGELPVGKRYPDSARYNAVVTHKFLIHNLSVTDPKILEIFSDLEPINIRQGYSRCSLLPLKNDAFITSDNGIAKVLKNRGLDVLQVNPQGIILPGFEHGFFGGTAGIFQDEIIFLGSLKHYPDGEKVRFFLQKIGYRIIEPVDEPLFDGGSVLFI